MVTRLTGGLVPRCIYVAISVFFSSYALFAVLLKTYIAIRQRHGRYKNKRQHIQILG
jgi:hypothetical protein